VGTLADEVQDVVGIPVRVDPVGGRTGAVPLPVRRDQAPAFGEYLLLAEGRRSRAEAAVD
jgi:hypothetical protein